MLLIQALSAPGDPGRPNEDAYAAQAQFAAVLDGATGLGGTLLEADSDAAWLARLGAERLAHHARTVTGRALLRSALTDVEAAFLAERLRPPTERYELPMASLMMVEALGERLTFSWFGDCTALLARPGSAVEVIGEALESRGQETRRAAQLAAELGIHPAGALSRPEFLADRRAARNRLNREGGPWVFAPDAACADHVLSVEVLAPAGSLVLLASDGLTALVADYQRYDPEGLVRAAETAGLQSLFDELRAVEAADPHGARYPRFKTSDDATGLVLRTTP